MALPVVGTGSFPETPLIGSEAYSPGTVPTATALRAAWVQALHWSQFGSVMALDQAYSVRPDAFHGGEMLPMFQSGSAEPVLYTSSSTWIDVGRARRRVPLGFNILKGVFTCKVPTPRTDSVLNVRVVLSHSAGTDTGPTTSIIVPGTMGRSPTADLRLGRSVIRGVHDMPYLDPNRGAFNARAQVTINNAPTGSDDTTNAVAPEVVLQAYVVSQGGTPQRFVPLNARAWFGISYDSGTGGSVIEGSTSSESVLLDGSGFLFVTSSQLQQTSSLTVSAWLRQSGNWDGTSNMHAVSDWSPAATARFALTVTTGGVCRAFVGTGSMAQFSVPSSNAWNHVCMVFSGSGTGNSGRLMGYVNGTLASASYSGTVPAIVPTGSVLRVGYDTLTDTGSYFQGWVDEVTYWSASLGSASIGQLYHSGQPGDPRGVTGGLASWWRMGDDSRDTVNYIFDAWDGRVLTASIGGVTIQQAAPFDHVSSSIFHLAVTHNFPFDATDYSRLVGWMQTHSRFHMWQEDASSGGTPITHASASSAVSAVDDPGPRAFRWEAQSNTTRPWVLAATSGSLSGGIVFGVSGSSTRLFCYNSQEAFKFIPMLTGSILFKFISNRDGSTQVVLDNNQGTTANAGFRLTKTNTDHFSFLVTKSTAGQALINHTTVATCRQGTGSMNVLIQLGDPTNGCRIKVGSEPWETMAVSNLPVCSITASAPNDLAVGDAYNGSANFLQGCIGSLMVFSGTVSDGTIGTFTGSFNPALTTGSLITSQSLGMMNFLYAWYDFTDATTLFSDSQGTVAVSNGQNVRYARHILDASGGLGRYATNVFPTDAINGPLFQGSSGVRFGGHDAPNQLSFRNAMHTGGGASYFMVVSNAETGSSVNHGGSHVLVANPGGEYWVETSVNYSGNPSFATPYHLLHVANGNTSPLCRIADGTTYALNIIEVRRDGNTLYGRSYGNGSTVTTASIDGGAGSSFAPRYIGPSGSTGWAMSGSIREVMLFNTYMSESQANLVLSQLAAKYGI
jgi:concanavalin A-like lectin/glucanase superfamily protein